MCIIFVEPHMILVAIDFCQIDIIFVGSPSKIGSIMILSSLVKKLHINGFMCLNVKYPHSRFFTSPAVHCVFNHFQFGRRYAYIHQRIIIYGRFIFLIKSEIIAFGRPKSTFGNPKFTTCNGLSAHNIFILENRNRNLVRRTVCHKQIITQSIRHIFIFYAKILIISLFRIFNLIFCLGIVMIKYFG